MAAVTPRSAAAQHQRCDWHRRRGRRRTACASTTSARIAPTRTKASRCSARNCDSVLMLLQASKVPKISPIRGEGDVAMPLSVYVCRVSLRLAAHACRRRRVSWTSSSSRSRYPFRGTPAPSPPDRSARRAPKCGARCGRRTWMAPWCCTRRRRCRSRTSSIRSSRLRCCPVHRWRTVSQEDLSRACRGRSDARAHPAAASGRGRPVPLGVHDGPQGGEFQRMHHGGRDGWRPVVAPALLMPLAGPRQDAAVHHAHVDAPGSAALCRAARC